jgi:hypothetical protein
MGIFQERIYAGHELVAIVEAGRLLNCSGAKLEAFLRRFNQTLLHTASSSDGDAPETVADETRKVFKEAHTRTYTNVLRSHRIGPSPRKVESGVIGIHTVPIIWWKSKAERIRDDYHQGRPKGSKQMKATLLVLANRSTNTHSFKTDRREHDIFFAILPRRTGVNTMTDIICDYVAKRSKTKLPVRQLFIVCNGTAENPKSKLDATLLSSRLTSFSIEVGYDKPSDGLAENAPFVIPTALPDEIAIENYLAVILKKTKIPAQKVTWYEIRASCHSDYDVAKFLGRFRPFIVDHSKRKPQKLTNISEAMKES